MIKINLGNIEQVILFDSNVLKLFDDLTDINKWKFGKKYNLEHATKESMINLLNSIDENQIIKLSNYFNCEVIVEKINNKKSWNDICYIDDLESYFTYNKPEYYYTSAWNGPGTSNTYPRASYDLASKNLAYSSLNVFSGNYLRLKNITLGYTLPSDVTKKIGISKFRIYASAVNLLTFTKYPGADPEVGQDINTAGNSQSYGVDRGLYPSSKTYNFGVNVTF